MTVRAYAKINLGLRILRKREDGYHDIETVFHRINLFDELEFESAESLSMTCNSADLPVDERNLCMKAASLMRRRYVVRNGVHITLRKNIPIGAGLGGGSSDAATALLSLARLWELKIKDDEMRSLAVQLGSDVPYFLRNGTAHATGRGETLDYFDLRLPYWIVVVFPKVSISTSWAYANARIPNRPATASLINVLVESVDDPRKLTDLLHNDFESLVLHSHPVIDEVRRELLDSSAKFVQMSGSGSSVYGLFANGDIARDVASGLNKRFQVFITPPLFCP